MFNFLKKRKKMILSDSEQKKLDALTSQEEKLKSDQDKLEEKTKSLAQVKQDKFNIQMNAYEKARDEISSLEEKAKLSVQNGGKIFFSFTVHGPNDDKEQTIAMDLSNFAIGDDPSLNTYRERLLNDAVSLYRQNITKQMLLLGQDNQTELRAFHEAKRDSKKKD
jgi:hypothetical protein